MKDLILKASSHVKGSIKLPGSKSITNRVLLMAALSNGTCQIIEPLQSEDTDQMINALISLGISITKNYDYDSDRRIQIKGSDGDFPKKI